jgi:hypothetical protein
MNDRECLSKSRKLQRDLHFLKPASSIRSPRGLFVQSVLGDVFTRRLLSLYIDLAIGCYEDQDEPNPHLILFFERPF